MARAADAKKLKVDAAGCPDRLLVALTLLRNAVARHIAARDVYVVRLDVDLGEQVLPHEAVIGVDAARIHRVVLVEIEGDHTAEAQIFLAVHPDELAINSEGGRTGGQTQDGRFTRPVPALDEVSDATSDQPAEFVVIVYHDGANPLERHPLDSVDVMSGTSQLSVSVIRFPRNPWAKRTLYVAGNGRSRSRLSWAGSVAVGTCSAESYEGAAT